MHTIIHSNDPDAYSLSQPVGFSVQAPTNIPVSPLSRYELPPALAILFPQFLLPLHELTPIHRRTLDPASLIHLHRFSMEMPLRVSRPIECEEAPFAPYLPLIESHQTFPFFDRYISPSPHLPSSPPVTRIFNRHRPECARFSDSVSLSVGCPDMVQDWFCLRQSNIELWFSCAKCSSY